MNYSIGKFAELSGFSIDTLRYYEKESLIIPKRDANNRRVFTEQDIIWMDFIKKLKLTGMKLKDIKVYAQLRYQGDETISERLELLLKQATILLEQKNEIDNHLDFLQKKIRIYKEMLAEKK
ncbi:DNA-binding transcriptional MerR regulator [Enterococcus sp. PF1-24]|uniref:MerR family transcriptional regulator n=1 Tax=unclassified Enterococcus TaxID=2608891 RepID=UPI0024751EA7|nr:MULTISPECIES: MerR family transcriptional regulator [unclassified Enterococcus]MDH6363258.1 DNA-binding transcriptional MerR regulator [Enterococcus sp. PFB1-1]MDH6400441.1 DNA-binding transcriptional MerR regulator [Enterococcus sp. PF1-24]